MARFPICTPDVQGMLTALQRQWLANSKPVPSQEIGVETPPGHLWRGRNRPGRRAALPFEGAWEGQNRRDNSGTCRRRKVLGRGARLDTPANRRLRPLELPLDCQRHRRHEPRVVGRLRIGHWRRWHRQARQLFPARLQGLQSGSTIEGRIGFTRGLGLGMSAVDGRKGFIRRKNLLAYHPKRGR
jgi:hypothetical protein